MYIYYFKLGHEHCRLRPYNLSLQLNLESGAKIGARESMSYESHTNMCHFCLKEFKSDIRPFISDRIIDHFRETATGSVYFGQHIYHTFQKN